MCPLVGSHCSPGIIKPSTMAFSSLVDLSRGAYKDFLRPLNRLIYSWKKKKKKERILVPWIKREISCTPESQNFPPPPNCNYPGGFVEQIWYDWRWMIGEAAFIGLESIQRWLSNGTSPFTMHRTIFIQRAWLILMVGRSFLWNQTDNGVVFYNQKMLCLCVVYLVNGVTCSRLISRF